MVPVEAGAEAAAASGGARQAKVATQAAGAAWLVPEIVLQERERETYRVFFRPPRFLFPIPLDRHRHPRARRLRHQSKGGRRSRYEKEAEARSNGRSERAEKRRKKS